jgi:parvulin-like peptidyl-prolyl isomerase
VRRLLPLLCSVALAFGPACGTVPPTAARVNGTEIPERELDEELQAIAGNERYLQALQQQGAQVLGTGRGTFDLRFVAQVLTRRILLELVHQDVVRRGVQPTESDRAQAQEEVIDSLGGEEVFGAFPGAYRADLVRRTAEVSRLRAQLGDVDVDDAAVRRFYDENASRLFAQACVSHILFAVLAPEGRVDEQATGEQADALRAEAEQARAEIEGGADFAAVATAHSRDNTNKDEGGDLGCGGPGRFVPEFERTVQTLSTGEVSQPVQTQFGIHLIKVTERRVQSLEEATPEIRQRLQAQGQAEFTRFLRDAVARARISVNPRYGRFEKEAQVPGVVPPEAPAPVPPIGPGFEGPRPAPPGR